MNKQEWASRVRSASELAGTYRPYFDDIIDTLAAILDKRDAIQKEFDESGDSVMITYTNKGGAENKVLHPLVRTVNELNRDALAYWRDLGLTPAGLKKIDETLLKKKKKSALAEALESLGG